MSWVLLALAIAAELAGTVAMKEAAGFTRPAPSALVFVLYGTSLALATLAQRALPVTLVYAVWSAVGTAGIAIIGIVWFREPLTTLKVVALLLIVAGVITLNLSEGTGQATH